MLITQQPRVSPRLTRRQAPSTPSSTVLRDGVQLSAAALRSRPSPPPRPLLGQASPPSPQSLAEAVARAAQSPSLRPLGEQDDPDQVQERVVQIVKDQLKVEEEKIVPEASFSEDLGADSLDQVDMVMAFETEFEIKFSDEEVAKMITVGDAIESIRKKLAEKP